jgi:hypothetical protein
MSGPRDVREIIDVAIRENRARERVLLIFAAVFVGLGAGVLVWGLIQDSLVAYAGVVESGLFVPAILVVRRINRENTALRMLEIPLRKARTSEEAERVLIRLFASVYGIDMTAGKREAQGK